jgi:hypothetical protein
LSHYNKAKRCTTSAILIQSKLLYLNSEEWLSKKDSFESSSSITSITCLGTTRSWKGNIPQYLRLENSSKQKSHYI